MIGQIFYCVIEIWMHECLERDRKIMLIKWIGIGIGTKVESNAWKITCTSTWHRFSGFCSCDDNTQCTIVLTLNCAVGWWFLSNKENKDAFSLFYFWFRKTRKQFTRISHIFRMQNIFNRLMNMSLLSEYKIIKHIKTSFCYERKCAGKKNTVHCNGALK